VRGAELGSAGPGALTWTWDGRDEAGRPSPAGVYRVRAVGRSGGMSRGLVRVE
jgi:flagellar hook assembly protein FlgD